MRWPWQRRREARGALDAERAEQSQHAERLLADATRIYQRAEEQTDRASRVQARLHVRREVNHIAEAVAESMRKVRHP